MNASRIAIIGGGCSGALAAIQLLQQSHNQEIELVIIEKSQNIGRGLAYNVPSDRCKLNVPANSMGASQNDPQGFFDWLTKNDCPATPNEFVSRDLFGRYLGDLLSFHQRQAPRVKLTHLRDKALDICFDKETDSFTVILAGQQSHKHLTCDICILALGNMPRAELNGISIADTFRSPYVQKSYDDIKEFKNILIVGTGLTAVDAVLEAEGRGFTGRYAMISRNGYLPCPHEETSAALSTQAATFFSACEDPGPLSIRAITRIVVQESRRLGSSQPAITALRPHLQKIWANFSDADKRRFLRHVRPLWEIHRHRIPKAHFDRLQALISNKRLTIYAANICSIKRSRKGVSVSTTPAVITEAKHFDAAFLCAGPESDLTKLKVPLVQNLLRRGIVQRGELGLGAHPTNTTLPEVARLKFRLLGPIQREALWEITAVRELRIEAENLAREVLSLIARTNLKD